MAELPPSLKRTPELDRWVAIDPDGTIRVSTGKVEIGQGILSALTLIAAEELDVHPTRVRVEAAVTGRSPNELITAGSMSVEDSGSAVRQACAHAKQRLLEAAAAELGTATEVLVTDDGTITSPGANRTLTYAELQGGKPFALTITELIAEKSPADYRWVGTRQPRVDLPAKLRGERVFVHDLAMDGLLHARVVRPPGYHHRLQQLDRTAIENLPGLHSLIVDGSFIAVLAADEYVAVCAMQRAERAAVWARQASEGTKQPDPSATLGEYLLRNETSAHPVVDGVATDAPLPALPAPRAGERVIRATYTRPYVMHGSLVPSGAMALWTGERLEVWSASQGIEILRPVLAEALGIPPKDITVRHSQGAGAYGHNGADDVAIDAAICARATPGRPVLLKWTREQEHCWEPYGPAMRMTLEARAGSDAAIAVWSHDVWSFTHMGRPMPGRLDAVAAWLRSNPIPRPAPAPRLGPEVGIHRNAWPAYRFPTMRVVKRFVAASPLRTSSLRGLGAQGNVFAIESFMDEVAVELGVDPVTLRLKHLDDPRARAVIERVVALSGGGPGKRATRGAVAVGRGLGYARYKNRQCYAAVMADVAVNLDDATIVVENVWIAGDAGCAIDPDGLVNQLEGGAIQAISWTLKEAVRFNADEIESKDWETYPILRFDEVPDVQTSLINRPHERALGAGEATQGPTTAAVANAVYWATGLRVRDLPITPERLRDAAGR